METFQIKVYYCSSITIIDNVDKGCHGNFLKQILHFLNFLS